MCSSNTILCVDPDLFYNKLDLRSKVLVILQNSPNCMIWQFFFGGGEYALNSLTKTIVAKLLFLFLYLYNNIICEIFSNVFFVIMLVCLRIGAYVHTGQKSQRVSDKSCIYPKITVSKKIVSKLTFKYYIGLLFS